MRTALLGEGNTDRALLPIVRWVLMRATPTPATVEWVDLTRIAGGGGLVGKVRQGLEVNPCDVLFVHRDADNQPPQWRYDEVTAAVGGHAHVAVVPIRTTETWLLCC